MAVSAYHAHTALLPAPCLSNLRMPVALFSKRSTGPSETDTSSLRARLRVRIMPLCSTLVDARLVPLYPFGATNAAGGVSYSQTVQPGAAAWLTQSLTTRPSHPPHKLSRLQVKYNIQVAVSCVAASGTGVSAASAGVGVGSGSLQAVSSTVIRHSGTSYIGEFFHRRHNPPTLTERGFWVSAYHALLPHLLHLFRRAAEYGR